MKLTETRTRQNDPHHRSPMSEHTLRELYQKVEQLQRLNEEKDYLVAAVAHDLRAPLHHMMGLAEIFLMDTHHLSAQQKECIEKMRESAAQLSLLVGKVLDSAAIHDNDLNVETRPVQFDVILAEVAECFRAVADKKNITVEIKSGCNPSWGMVDTQYLRRIYENLLSNAIKFSPRQGRVTLKLYTIGDKVITEISDTGPGFTPVELPCLFRKFQKFQARPTASEASYGLGLSIVKKYVDLMNGEITCESMPGHGATFRLGFPQVRGPEA